MTDNNARPATEAAHHTAAKLAELDVALARATQLISDLARAAGGDLR